MRQSCGTAARRQLRDYLAPRVKGRGVEDESRRNNRYPPTGYSGEGGRGIIMKCAKECVYNIKNNCTDTSTELLCVFTEKREKREKEKTIKMITKAHKIRKTEHIQRIVAECRQHVKDYEKKVQEQYRYDSNQIALERIPGLSRTEKYSVSLELTE